MHIAVIGAGGRLGAVLRPALAAAGHAVTPLHRADVDACSRHDVSAVIARLRPDAVVNCAAYNAVDRAETEQAAAFAVNASAPAHIAEAAERVGALVVHYSTDFVFDGATVQPYTEDVPPNPLGVYGASKLAGEYEVRKMTKHFILRVSSLFGGHGVNGHSATIDVIAKRLLAGGPVDAFVDRTVSPSYVPDVVRTTVFLLENSAPFGTYHCVTSGVTTWYGLAVHMADHLRVQAAITPVSAANVTTRARRPQFCAMSNAKLLALGADAPDWRSAVARHLVTRQAEGVQFECGS
jgi:dTDP-4-dehydrorhamnose reductase